MTQEQHGGQRPAKKRIPNPKDVLAKHGSHKPAFDLLVEQYAGNHIDFEIMGEPVPAGDAENSVYYLVRRFDKNPSEQAVPSGL